MENILCEKFWKFSHQLHKLWFILQIADELMFLLDLKTVVSQNDFFQVFLLKLLASVNQSVKRFIIEALGHIDKLFYSSLQILDRSIPNCKCMVGLVSLIKAAIEWAVIKFQWLWLERSRAVVSCGWQLEGSWLEVVKSVCIFEKSVVLLVHVYEYFFIYTNNSLDWEFINSLKLVIKLIVTNLIL